MLVDRLKAVQAMSRDYTSFGGTDTDQPGSVQFILRTDSIA